MRIKAAYQIFPQQTIRHLPFGSSYSQVSYKTSRLYCEECSHSHMRFVPFKAGNHQITLPLKQMVEDLLATGWFTNKQIAELTGLGQQTVAQIDKARLSSLYVEETDEGPKLRKPDTYAIFLAIDEFKFHNGHQYATHIIDLETEHVLWIARGKNKQVVYDFIEHVGLEWMKHVKAVACDMNSDFQEAFQEHCDWISIVFDHFHIVKNFNDKVISEVRKDVQRELIANGDKDKARLIKGPKYILTSSPATLAAKDARGEEGKPLRVENTLFGLKPVLPKTGYVGRYRELLKMNELFVACDLVKEQLDQAFECTDEVEMANQLAVLIDTCRGAKNRHFEWFARLIENHFEGILAHAVYEISSGKVEGINNKIKTIRRQAYRYRDDGYFFLKIIDASRIPITRNPESHKISH